MQNEKQIVLGVDPGYSGAFVFSDGKDILHQCKIIIDKNELINGKILLEHLAKIDYFHMCNTVVLEHPHSIFGIAASANWKLGESFGSLYTFLSTHFENIVLVRPKKWQKSVLLVEDIVLKKDESKDTKKTSIKACERLFPDHDFRDLVNKPRARVADHNFCDAALLSKYYFNIQ